MELDLLRGGMRLPVVDTLPPGDYYASTSRAKLRPKSGVYAWTLSDNLPVIPIPLKLGNADASVPLREVSDIVYQRARYDVSVKYTATFDPPLMQYKLRWVEWP